ncbi:unnamed protein product, partial [Medioppia subpectinata]
MDTHSTVRTDRVNTCPVGDCRMSFKSEYELISHRLTHDSRVECGADGCNEIFHTLSQRLRHRVSVHNRRTHSYRRGKQWFEWKGKTETQEVMQTMGDNERVNEDMFDNLYDSNGLELRIDIKEEPEIYFVETINTDMSSTSNEMQTQVNSTSKSSTSQSSQEMVNKDMSGKSSKDSMEMKSNESMTEFLQQNKSEREKCFNLTTNTFICPINDCHKSYETDSQFATHLCNVHTSRHHVCTHEGCGKAYKTKSHLNVHQLTHYSSKSYDCPHNGCQYKAMNNHYLKIHLSSHSVLAKRNRHLLEAHSRPLINGLEDKHQFRCRRVDCGQEFTTNEMLAQHMNVHNCVDQTTDSIGSQPENKPKTGQPGTITCVVCSETNGHRERIRGHKTVPFGDSNGLALRSMRRLSDNCLESDECIHDFIYLEQHVRTHSTDRRFRCDVGGCEKTFRAVYELTQHRRTHSAQPTYKCGADGCNDMFYSPSIRLKHQVLVHNRRPYVQRRRPGVKHRCEWPGCDYEGPNGSLRKHTLVHTGERPHGCHWPDCGKRFTLSHQLNEHMNIHLNVK